MPLFAATVFLSAFLLFLVQPMIAKQILPWFGGAAGVWTTCLVFFQSALLAGYAYPDLIARKLAPKKQAWLHTALLLGSCAVLPVIAGEYWKPASDTHPIFGILALLAGVIGLPYVMLSTTSPMVQTWFARAHPGVNPYRLFALSNVASMLALLSYPFLIEPAIGVKQQAWIWSGLYGLFVLLAIACAFRSARAAAALPLSAGAAPGSGEGSGDRAATSANDAVTVMAGWPGTAQDNAALSAEHPPTGATQMLWCALSATGSILLLGISNHVTQNISSIPLLWVVPLALYLLTFILCFDGQGWYKRKAFMIAAGCWLAAMGATLITPDLKFALKFQIALFFSGLFVVCMFCHGELTLAKPAPKYLTRFYLMIALGGALGAILTGIVAPLALPAYYEFEIGLTLAAVLLLLRTLSAKNRIAITLAGLLVAGGIGVTITQIITSGRDAIFTGRNFYTVLRVKEYGMAGDDQHSRVLVHGVINHGEQFLSPEYRRAATRYYGSSSGIGRALTAKYDLPVLKVGILGLGAGAVTVYARGQDHWRMYEINPMVPEIARREFSYLADSPARIDVVLGDGRLTIEREAAQGYDLLAMDAFSSDSVPAHLITSEAISAYERHLKPDAILAIHVSNRFLDLAPVIRELAVKHGFHGVIVYETGSTTSDWILLSKSKAMLEHPKIKEVAQELPSKPGIKAWSDDFHNIVQVLR